MFSHPNFLKKIGLGSTSQDTNRKLLLFPVFPNAHIGAQHGTQNFAEEEAVVNHRSGASNAGQGDLGRNKAETCQNEAALRKEADLQRATLASWAFAPLAP